MNLWACKLHVEMRESENNFVECHDYIYDGCSDCVLPIDEDGDDDLDQRKKSRTVP